MDNNETLIKDRELILKSYTNLGLVHSLVQGFGSIDEDPLTYYNTTFNIPQYSETEKFGILYTSKGGSSLINQLLRETDLELKLPNNDLWHPKFKSKMVISRDTLIKEEFGDFDKICEGKSKKDLIIVTRNPIYKWLSGVWQELDMELQKSNASVGYLRKLYSGETVGNDLDSLNEKVFSEFMYMFLRGLIERYGKVAWSHAALYNETYYNFLELNPDIDKTKLKIIDIDTEEGNLVDLISSYYPEIKSSQHSKGFWTHRKRHYKILDSIIQKVKKDIQLQKIITNDIHRDFFYKNLLNTRYAKYFYGK